MPIPPRIPLDQLAWLRPGRAVERAPGQAEEGIGERTVQVFPPWLWPIPSALEFFRQTTATLPAGAGQSITPAALVVRAPSSEWRGVVRVVQIFIDAPTTAFDITWTVLVNGSPYPGWDNLRMFPRTAGSVELSFDGIIRLPQGAEVAIRITNNNANGPWTVGAGHSGWFWPMADERRIYGGIVVY